MVVVALCSMPLLLLLYQTRHAQADTANADALARRAARKEWRQGWQACVWCMVDV